MMHSMMRMAAVVAPPLAWSPALHATVVHFDGFEGPECSAEDVDGDRLSECAERSQKTDPLLADTDDDGHEDGEEVLGTLGGLDLRALGADARRRDILVEYD